MIRIEDEMQLDDALIIVDVQKDFCPGGALPVKSGDEIIPALNRCIRLALDRFVHIYASRDWHPSVHVSFKGEGGHWPPHCIQDTDGARFHPALELPDSAVRITKGVRFDHDQNSVFDETGFAYELRKRGILRLWVGGLAEDVCVLASVLDGIEAGFEVFVLADAVRPITPQGGAEARLEMGRAGAQFARAGVIQYSTRVR
jgi:nicotinamidase/pyrazinamidase